MTLSLGVFLAIQGLHIGLTMALLAIAVDNSRRVGEDELARKMAAEAEDQTQYLAKRLTRHLRVDHDQDPEIAPADD